MGSPNVEAWSELGYTDTDTGGIKWKDLEKLLNLDEEYNRIDRGNAFGAWEYDPETKTQQYVAKSPGMQAAQDRMDRRLAGEGFEPYEAPKQVSSIMDALMANKMEKMGLIEPGATDLTQDDYGTRFADRSGSPTAPAGGYPPPPQPPAAAQPPVAPQPPTAQPPGLTIPGGQPVGGSPGGAGGKAPPGTILPHNQQMTPEERRALQLQMMQGM